MNLLISTLVIMLTVAISNIIARYVKGIASTYINLILHKPKFFNPSACGVFL